MMQRRQFLKQSIGVAGMLATARYSHAKTATKPNILFIIIEDLSTNLGCYDKPYIKTPNIDKLARRGVQFDRAFANQPVCAASRASFLTGLRPQTTGVDYPYSYYFLEEIEPNHPTLSQYFSGNGYDTRNFGKIHHGKALDEECCPSFDGDASRYQKPENLEIIRSGTRSERPPFEMADQPDDQYRDGQCAAAVVRQLKQRAGSNTPFCYSVGFHKPHLPLAAPKKYWDLYDREDIPLPENRQRPQGAPDIAYNRYNLQQYQWEHAEPEKQFSASYDRMLRHAYFACVSFVDAQIGKIMDTLKKTGELDNTIIALVTDHGFHIGELNNWGKTTLFEESLHIPMIISTPELPNHNIRTDALVELVDIFPTLIDLAGYDVPDYMEGVSVAPLMNAPERQWKKAAFSNTPRDLLGRKRGYSIRTDRYRYTEWRQTVRDEIMERELYDLEMDPHETQNLATDAAQQDVIAKLSARLNADWKQALPPGIENRSDNPPAPPAYAWGPEGKSRRDMWHEVYGGAPDMGWRAATKMRLRKEKAIKNQE